MPTAETVGLQQSALQGKIEKIKGIEEALKDGTQICALKFGTDNVSQSRCLSANEMEILNNEYALVAASFSKLVGATAQFLEHTMHTLEKADTTISGNLKQL